MAVGGLKMSLLICCLTNEISARTKTRSLVEKLNVVTSSTTTSDWDGVWQSLVVGWFRQLCYCLIEKNAHGLYQRRLWVSSSLGLIMYLAYSPILHGTVFFNRGSARGCQAFRRNRPKSLGMKFSTAVLCDCSNATVSQVYYRK